VFWEPLDRERASKLGANYRIAVSHDRDPIRLPGDEGHEVSASQNTQAGSQILERHVVVGSINEDR
jgi:hypothetical protein